ncbi:hypothetical protein [Alkaliphilus serpentinus]|uniref:hypothetical protein n=1 Tax=Alkaliphilus serpentinus TaxID=1482731 RepID=UPI00186578E2|nr:hypothetical protein [Alkaliphilus serpentinus]
MNKCNKEDCLCPKANCPRHGNCCQCINHHLKIQTLVYCMRSMAKKENLKA